MSGGGSKKGRKLSQYRRGDFWPASAEQIMLHALLLAWPLTGYARLRAKHCRPRSNVRATL